MQKNEKYSCKTHSYKMRGVTLFETLLYIALFSVISLSSVSVMSAVSNTINQIQIVTKKSEIQLIFYEILRSKIDGNTCDMQDVCTVASQINSLQDNLKESFNRVLKIYPQFTLKELSLYQVKDEYNVQKLKLEYVLEKISTKGTHKDIYKETLSISLI